MIGSKIGWLPGRFRSMEILSLDTATTQVEVAPEGLDPERPRDVNGGFLSHGTPNHPI